MKKAVVRWNKMQWYDHSVCSKGRFVPLLADWCCDKRQYDFIRGNRSVSGCWNVGLWQYWRTALCWEVAEIP